LKRSSCETRRPREHRRFDSGAARQRSHETDVEHQLIAVRRSVCTASEVGVRRPLHPEGCGTPARLARWAIRPTKDVDLLDSDTSAEAKSVSENSRRNQPALDDNSLLDIFEVSLPSQNSTQPRRRPCPLLHATRCYRACPPPSN
jgi:hypothetical protein